MQAAVRRGPVCDDGVCGPAGRHVQGRPLDRQEPGAFSGEHPEANRGPSPASRLRLPQRPGALDPDQDRAPSGSSGLRRPDHLGEDVRGDRADHVLRRCRHGHRPRHQLRVHPLRGAHLPQPGTARLRQQGHRLLHQQPSPQPQVPRSHGARRDGEGEPHSGREAPDGCDELSAERRRGSPPQGHRPPLRDQQREQRAGGDR